MWAQECDWVQFKHENGAVASEGCFENGVPVGVWKSYDDRGMLLSEGERQNNQPQGLWKFYNQGVLRETAEFVDGQKDGVQTIWVEGLLTDSVRWTCGAAGRRVHGVSTRRFLENAHSLREGQARRQSHVVQCTERTARLSVVQTRQVAGFRIVQPNGMNKAGNRVLGRCFIPSGRVSSKRAFYVEGFEARHLPIFRCPRKCDCSGGIPIWQGSVA